jgi:hypothetical protein
MKGVGKVGVLLVLVGTSVALLGDEPKKGDVPVRGHLPQHFKQLGLSDQQKADIFKVQAIYGPKIEVLNQQIRDLKKAEAKEILELLTDAQKGRLRELKAGDDSSSRTKDPEKKPDKDKP